MVEFRLAKFEELEVLTLASKEAFHTDVLVGGEENDGPPEYDSLKWHQKMYEDKHLYSFLVDGILVGGAVVFEHSTFIHIGRIFIHPSYMRRGYGWMLMHAIESYFLNATLFELETPIWNVRTNSLYLKCGYIETFRDEECIFYRKCRQID